MSVINIEGRNCDNLYEANIVVMAKDSTEYLKVTIYKDTNYCGTYNVHGGLPIEKQLDTEIIGV